MRLPPPFRRYSPISVITCTSETVSRPNSPSSAARSSCSSSKISFPLMRGGALNPLCSPVSDVMKILLSIRPVIRKLQVNPKIVSPQQSDDFLQRVAVLAADPHQVALNRGLRFLLRILNQLHNLARLFDGNPLLHRDFALRGSARRRFHSTVSQPLQRDPALDQFLLENIVHR